MSPLHFPEFAAIVFAADRRVFVTPEVANPRVGEDSLLQALRPRYSFHEEDLLRVDLSFADAYAVANPKAREMTGPLFEQPLEAGDVAFRTTADRVFLVHDDHPHPTVTCYSRFLGATLFMETFGARPLAEVINRHPAPGISGSHIVRTPVGPEFPVHHEDLDTILDLAQRQHDALSSASPRRIWLSHLIKSIDAKIGPVEDIDPSEGRVIQGPWGR